MTASSDYNWRFVLDGTDEAKTLRSRPSGILIDPLHSHEELPDDDPFVEAARSGDVSALHTKTTRSETTTTQSEQISSRRPVTRSQTRRRQAAARARQNRLAKPRRPVKRRKQTKQPAADPVKKVAPPSRKRFWWILATGIFIACVVIFFVVRLVLLSSETTWLEQHGLSKEQFAHRNFFWNHPIEQPEVFTRDLFCTLSVLVPKLRLGNEERIAISFQLRKSEFFSKADC